jgi:hypothetical protein
MDRRARPAPKPGTHPATSAKFNDLSASLLPTTGPPWPGFGCPRHARASLWCRWNFKRLDFRAGAGPWARPRPPCSVHARYLRRPAAGVASMWDRGPGGDRRPLPAARVGRPDARPEIVPGSPAPWECGAVRVRDGRAALGLLPSPRRVAGRARGRADDHGGYCCSSHLTWTR